MDRKPFTKVFRLLLAMIILATTFFQPLAIQATSTRSYDMTGFIREGSITYLFGNLWGTPVRMTDWKVNEHGEAIFCLDRDLPSPDNDGLTRRDTLSPGLNYIVMNHLEGGDFLTGNARRDFYITQMAVRVYQDGGSDAHLRDAQGNLFADPDGVIPRIMNIVNKAMSEGLPKPIFNNSISVNPRESAFSRNGDVFETEIFTVSANGNLTSYDIEFTGAPEGTEVVRLDNNRFKLRTDISNIRQTSYSVNVNVVGNFSNEYRFATHYAPPAPNIQNIVFPTEHIEIEQLSAEAARANLSFSGTINLTKTGDVVTGVTSTETDHGDLYKFVFNQKPLAGAEFELIAAEDIATGDTIHYEKGAVVDRGITDDDGTLIFTPQFLGRYYLKEVAAPKGYVLDGRLNEVELAFPDQEVDVTSNVTVENRWQELKLELEKHSEDNIPLKGVVFGVFNANDFFVNDELILEAGSLVGLTTTNENGRGEIVGHFPEMEFYAQELETIPNFVLDDTLHLFTYEASNNEAVQVISISREPIINIAQRGTIDITKTGDMLIGTEIEETEFGNKHRMIFGQRPLAGAVFEVRAAEDIYILDGQLQHEEGSVVDTVTTGEDGTVSTDLLHLGRYTLKEIEAPPGFVLTNREYEVELVYAGQNVKVTSTDITVENALQEVEVSLPKVAEFVTGWSNGVAETEMQAVEGITFGIFTREELVISEEIAEEVEDLSEGEDQEYDSEEELHEEIPEDERDVDDQPKKNVIPADTLIALAVTDEDGIATFLQQFPEGQFYLKELQTTEEHVLLTDEFDFEIAFEDNNEKLFIQLFEEPLENHLKRGTLEITKVDAETDRHLANAEFAISQNNEDVATIVTGSEGIANIELPFGNYEVREIRAPEGYVLDDTVHEFKITEDGQVVEITVANIREPQETLPQTGHGSLLFSGMSALSFIIASITTLWRAKK